MRSYSNKDFPNMHTKEFAEKITWNRFCESQARSVKIRRNCQNRDVFDLFSKKVTWKRFNCLGRMVFNLKVGPRVLKSCRQKCQFRLDEQKNFVKKIQWILWKFCVKRPNVLNWKHKYSAPIKKGKKCKCKNISWN